MCFFSGEMNGMVYILNTRYEIFYRDRKDDVELEDADGYVDFYNKKIVICTLDDWDNSVFRGAYFRTPENLILYFLH